MAPCYFIDFTVGWSFGEPQDKQNDQLAHRRMVAGRGILTNHGRNSNSPATGIIVAMITRRDSLVGAIALLCDLAAANAEAQNNKASQPSQSEGGLVFKHDLPNITMEDWEVTVSHVDYSPGRVGKVHHHAGFVLAYVLEGNIVTKISGQEERTYKPGEMFFEPPGSTHEVSRNASETQPGKLLALIFAKKGAQLTMPGPA